jgi:hypothetical protein
MAVAVISASDVHTKIVIFHRVLFRGRVEPFLVRAGAVGHTGTVMVRVGDMTAFRAVRSDVIWVNIGWGVHDGECSMKKGRRGDRFAVERFPVVSFPYEISDG